MEITQEQYEKIEKYLPRQRGNVSMMIIHDCLHHEVELEGCL